jgi:hypothetical protein
MKHVICNYIIISAWASTGGECDEADAEAGPAFHLSK